MQKFGANVRVSFRIRFLLYWEDHKGDDRNEGAETTHNLFVEDRL